MRIMFSLFILLAAIQTYAVMSIDTLKAKLDGRWEWVSTYGGYAGETYTPQSVYYSLALVFSKNVPQLKSDSIGYQVYRNDTLILSGFITLSSSAVQMKAFGPGNHIYGLVENISDTLLLGVGISDGYSSIFVRPTTSLKRVQPLARAPVPGLPSDYSLIKFTLTGRRINANMHRALPAQISVSRQHATIKGIGKK
jgi:hypothetical protein